MPRRLHAACALAAALLADAGPARAQVASSLNRSGSGARAAGMANAFVAVSDDGTAASWNPAGLAQLRKPELSLVYTVSDRGVTFTGMRSADGLTAYSNRGFDYTGSSPDFASVALPFTAARKPATVQLGWQRIYQLNGSLSGPVLRTPLAEGGLSPARVLVDNELRGDIDRGSLSAAVKLSSRLSVGGSFNLWRGAWREQLRIVEPSTATADFADIRAANRIRGWNVTGGLLLTYPRFNLGLVYHSGFWSSFRYLRDAHASGLPPESYNGGSRAEFHFPRLFGAGIAWRPGPRWTVALDLTHDPWRETLLEGLTDLPAPVNFFDGLPREFSTTRDTTSFNVGGEHLFLREGSVLPLRLGFAWEPQGAMDSFTRDPVDWFMVAAGGGYNTNSLKFDAALQYRWSAFRGSDIVGVASALSGGALRDAFGLVRGREWRLKVSAIYRIPDTEALRGLVRKIF